jgi:hypothetical protein
MHSHSRGVDAFQDDVWQSRDNPAARDERTFPGPWSVNQIPQGYRVLDANHRVLAYVVTDDKDTKNKSSLTLEEAWRIARVISSLPDLIPESPTRRTKWSLWKSMRGSN